MNDLADLRAEVAELRREMRAGFASTTDELQLLARRSLSKDDRRDLVRLLPAAWALFGSQSWTAEDLSATAASTAGPHALALVELVADYATEHGKLKSFGRFLARVDGTTAAGLRLVQLSSGGDRGGAVYRIKTERGFEAEETTALPGAGADHPAA